MEQDNRIKLHVFEGETTYSNDYRMPKPDIWEITKHYKERDEKARRSMRKGTREKLIPECHETITKYREGGYVPFNLLWSAKPITQPEPEYNVSEERIDLKKEDVIKNRPRLYIAPAVSIDDVPDKEMRRLLIDFMYTTDFRKAEQEAISYVLKKRLEKKCPIKGIQDGKKKERLRVQDIPQPLMKYVPDLYPPAPEGWRWYFEKWDKLQRRACVDPTKNFWLNFKHPPQCPAGEDPSKDILSKEKQEEIKKLIEKNELRLPYEKTMQNYAGYKPKVAKGVPLQLKTFPPSHPLLTTNQAITSRYAQDLAMQQNVEKPN